jgi:hypothetical protein
MSDDLSNFDPPDASRLGVEAAKAAAAQAEDSPLSREVGAMMHRSGVIMAGESRDTSGRPAILVGVKTAKDMAKIPSTVGGFPVVIQVIGEVVAQ